VRHEALNGLFKICNFILFKLFGKLEFHAAMQLALDSLTGRIRIVGNLD
jgi:hypothetical protein